MSDVKPEKRRTEFLTAEQLAEALQVSEATIHRLRRAGRIPFVKITPKIIRYHWREVKQAFDGVEVKRLADLPEDDFTDSQMSFEDLFADRAD